MLEKQDYPRVEFLGPMPDDGSLRDMEA